MFFSFHFCRLIEKKKKNFLIHQDSSRFINAVGIALIVICVQATPKHVCPPNGVATVPHKRSCQKYFMCFDGNPIEQRCADGLLYDHRIQNCNLEKDVRCSLDVCPSDTVGIIQMVPHPEECSKYFACTRGQSFPLQCNGNLLFNRKTGSCDIAENVFCVSERWIVSALLKYF